MKVPSKERIRLLLHRSKALDVSKKRELEAVRKALLRVVEEKDRDPEDIDPFLRNFIEKKNEDVWLGRLIFFIGISSEEGDIVGGIYGRAADEKKAPFVAHYIPLKASYLKQLCKGIGFYDKEISLRVQHKNYYELVAFSLGDEIGSSPLTHEDLFFTIGGFDTTLILKNMPPNVELCLGSVPVVTSKKDKLQNIISKSFMLELLRGKVMVKKKKGILTEEDFEGEKTHGIVEGAYEAFNGNSTLDYGELVSELSTVKSIDWNLIVRYSNFLDRRIAPVDTWSEEGNWSIWGTSIPWLVNHLARDLSELNVLSSIGGALIADR